MTDPVYFDKDGMHFGFTGFKPVDDTDTSAPRWFVNRTEYAICQKRGHVASGLQRMSNPPWDVCKWCGCTYRGVESIEELI